VDIKVSHRGHNPHFKDEETEVLRGKLTGLAGQWQSRARVSWACTTGGDEWAEDNKPAHT